MVISEGGLYGDIFPDTEKDKLNTKNADIKGKTSMLKIYSAVLDWQEAGLGEKVFGTLDGHECRNSGHTIRYFCIA